eukprot:403353547
MNKLDYLAQKEEELRRLNDQLEQRKQNVMNDEDEEEVKKTSLQTKSIAASAKSTKTGFNKKQQQKVETSQKLNDSLDDDQNNRRNNPFSGQGDDEFDGQFSQNNDRIQSAKSISNQSTSHLIKEAKQLRESYQRDPSQQIPAGSQSNNYDDDFNQALSEVERYREVLDKSKEQEKVIQFQKIKIAALQAELEEALKSQNKSESQQEDLEIQNKKLLEEAKKFNEKMNQSTQQMQKLKQQNQDLQTKITSLEKSLQEQNKELDLIERDKKKTVQEGGSKDAKLNRAIEELEKYKIQWKEAKATEISKSDTLRKDMDRLLEENRKLERQRNELMQAFKKQMKLIDILKKQKMHIEAAKLLAFTEDEFVKTLELGDKM